MWKGNWIDIISYIISTCRIMNPEFVHCTLLVKAKNKKKDQIVKKTDLIASNTDVISVIHMCIYTEWPHGLENKFTSCMSVKWGPRKMNWKICIAGILSWSRRKGTYTLDSRPKDAQCAVCSRDTQCLLRFFYVWMGYAQRGAQWNWPPSMGFDFDR